METDLRSPKKLLVSAVLLLLGLVPMYSSVFDSPYYMTYFARIMVFAIAALSLSLILSFGGMVSFGHALYLGVGAYAVGISAFHGVTSGWMHVAAAIVASGVIALLTGIICLRTTGIAFIMITLAFAQMFFFLAISLKYYGGDDGLSIAKRSDFSPLADLDNNTVFYYFVFALLLAFFYFSNRLIQSHFGMVLRGCKSNERRMIALGFPTLRYKLFAYVLSSVMCAIAGVLLANLTRFASPEYMSWVRSGDLILMIVVGGMNTLFGPVVGAITLLVLEEILSSWTDHWMAILGPLIIIMVITAKQGLYGAVVQWEARRASRTRT